MKPLETNYLFEDHPIGMNHVVRAITVLPSLRFRFFLEHHHPSSLKILGLSGDFNHPIEKDVLPQTLTELHLGHEYNLPIENIVFPSSLQALDLGFNYNLPISKNVLLPSLQKLHLGFDYNLPIANDVLPNYVLVRTSTEQFMRRCITSIFGRIACYQQINKSLC